MDIIETSYSTLVSLIENNETKEFQQLQSQHSQFLQNLCIACFLGDGNIVGGKISGLLNLCDKFDGVEYEIFEKGVRFLYELMTKISDGREQKTLGIFLNRLDFNRFLTK